MHLVVESRDTAEVGVSTSQEFFCLNAITYNIY